MIAFLAKRIGYLLLTLFIVSLLIFLVFEFTPGLVARKILGPYATSLQVSLLTEQLGLNRFVGIRYGEWLLQLLKGDFGYSTLYRRPVNDIFWERLSNTLILASISFSIIVPCSLILGIVAGISEGSRIDRAISIVSVIATSIPEFASGAFLVSIFVIWLKILPGTSTLVTGEWSSFSQMILPVAVMVLYDLGYVVRMVRASMIEVMSQAYIRTAILKGLPLRRVIVRHALRNAMIAPFTIILLQLNYLVTGVVVVEAVFAYPGFGRMMLEAGLAQDVAVIQAGALFSVILIVFTQIVGDVGYRVLNPRISFD